MIGQQQRNQSEPFLASISDAKTPKGAAGNGQALGYAARIVNLQDYYPFGMLQPGRQFSEEGYGYGYQGSEKDDEVAGEGNSYTAKFWQYDSRLGRRWNVDPITYPWHGGYVTMNNNPIYWVDTDGLYSKKRAERKKSRAEKKDYQVSEIYQSGEGKRDYGFNVQREGEDGNGRFIQSSSFFNGRVSLSSSDEGSKIYYQDVEARFLTDYILPGGENYGTPVARTMGIGGNFALLEGFNFELGVIYPYSDDPSSILDGKLFVSFGSSYGLDLSGGVFGGVVWRNSSRSNSTWRGDQLYQYAGASESYEAGVGPVDGAVIWDNSNPTSQHTTQWNNALEKGRNYREIRGGLSIGSPIGLTYQRTRTFMGEN